MSSWIIHLRIAENLLGIFPELDPERFALGNIAQDSGIPDEKWETFKPPAAVMHFSNKIGVDRKLADPEFYRQYPLPLRGNQDVVILSFRLGYFPLDHR